MSETDHFKKVIAHAKEYGFVFPSSDIYDGLSAVYDYGQQGVLLKNNIRNYWWKSMVQLNDNIVGLDAAIFMHPTTWKASGHVDAFNDPLIDNKDSKKRYRADVLIEDYITKLEVKIEKEVTNAPSVLEMPLTGISLYRQIPAWLAIREKAKRNKYSYGQILRSRGPCRRQSTY